MYNKVLPPRDFDQDHLLYVELQLSTNPVLHPRDADVPSLNNPITALKVENTICRSTLGKSVGVDNIPAEVLRYSYCVVMLQNIFTYNFEHSYSHPVYE